ncbi:MAG: hypothetical protein HY868_24100 [Chloroflexi bacterium]|nr:hypothetical protein [Chloroflexota bacterium]
MDENLQSSAVGGQQSRVAVVGIDAGGTHSRAWLANERGDILGKGEAGPGNPHVGGTDAARREILTAIQRACDDARIEKQTIAAACLGIAGVARPDERADWTTWAREFIAPRIAMCNDGEIVIAAGTPENWGVALIAGTGSSAWGKARDGRRARAGGWGWLIGDEGSGFEMARHALRAASQAADGRGEPTRLGDAILAFWNLREPQDLIARVYRSGLKNADIAALASVVVRVADEGDAVAHKLIDDAGASLAIAIGAVARSLQIERVAIPLALTGGLLLDAPGVRERLFASARERGFNFAPVTLVHDPVLGAVRLALELLGRG